uniref:Cytochrome P450 n=1 Tax=Timema cristinae TaxID=61476 RepID=A0A7R9CD01_TIMCR|nr:unnamed protein product [Timema cristinae]
MLTLVLFVGILGLILYKLTSKPKNFPPGPFRWPLIGHALKFKLADLPTHLVMQDLKRSHGNVTGFFMAKYPMVLVSGLAEIREALAKPEFQGRPISEVNKLEKERLVRPLVNDLRRTKQLYEKLPLVPLSLGFTGGSRKLGRQPCLLWLADDKGGVVFTDGDIWRDARRFTLRHLREMGMGKHSMEEQIQEETRALMKDAKRMAGDDWSRPVPVHDLIAASGVNIILQLIAGYRFERDDPRMSELMKLVKKLTMKINTSGGLASSFPILLRVFPWLTEYPAFKVIRDEIRQYCQGIINDHEKKLDENDASDFLDAYLIEMKKHGETSTFNSWDAPNVPNWFHALLSICKRYLEIPIPQSGTVGRQHGSYSGVMERASGSEISPETPICSHLDFTTVRKLNKGFFSFLARQLIGVVNDLFIAGSDTTTGALAYGILNMVLNPKIQNKIQDEIDAVVGRERLPSSDDRIKSVNTCLIIRIEQHTPFKDRSIAPPWMYVELLGSQFFPGMPYTDATINEILRFANVAPLAVPHSVLISDRDVTFRGYNIPQGTRIIINLFDLHMDRKYWGDPDNFRPERFLESNGTVRKDEALLPFGQGKRSCLGESLARSNLFITFTSLLQNFALRLPEGVPRPSTEPEGGLTFTTKPFSIVMKPRNV